MYFYRIGNNIRIGGDLIPYNRVKLINYRDGSTDKRLISYDSNTSEPVSLIDLQKPNDSVYGSWTEVESTISVDTLISQTFAGELNLSTGGEVSYKIYASNVAETPTVSTPLVENSVCRVVIDAGAAASLVDTNLGTKRDDSDDFTVSKQNELLVFVFPDGTDGALVKSYSIKILN